MMRYTGKKMASVHDPVITEIAERVADKPACLSLCQGLVWYGPDKELIASEAHDIANFHGNYHHYAADEGDSELRSAFAQRLRDQHGFDGEDWTVIVTAGANCAFLQTVLSICDPGDEVVLLKPYYFNYEMAVRLADCTPVLVSAPLGVTDKVVADIADLLRQPNCRIRAVVTISPNNPTGIVYKREPLEELRSLCIAHRVYHVSDETYAGFATPSAADASLIPFTRAPYQQSITIFTASKGLGMAGWRVGFLVVPKQLRADMLKTQDTNIICASRFSQRVALRALRASTTIPSSSQCSRIDRVRTAVVNVLASPDAAGVLEFARPDGAFYIFARFTRVDAMRAHLDEVQFEPDPDGSRSFSKRVVHYLIDHFHIAVLPGIIFGDDHAIRVAFGCLREEEANRAARRLVEGVQALCSTRA